MNKRNLLSLLILFTLTISGCKTAPNTVQTGIESTATPVTPPVAQTAPLGDAVSHGDDIATNLRDISTASPTPVTIASSTPEPPIIVVSAVKGNVFIRRGPELAFNPVSVLMDGQSARALARDVLSKWLQISIPDHPGETGWISIQTHFIEVSGDVKDLPESTPTDWPILASLRNCTHHLMIAQPAGIFIPAANTFPDNEVQINPGVYTVHDIEVDGSPEVMEVEIKEGSEIEIRNDGNGEHKKCVTP